MTGRAADSCSGGGTPAVRLIISCLWYHRSQRLLPYSLDWRSSAEPDHRAESLSVDEPRRACLVPVTVLVLLLEAQS